MSQTTPFTAAELTDIRRFAGYPAYGAFGYVYAAGMAVLDTQCAAMSDAEQAVIRTVYLANLGLLEAAIIAAGANLDTDRAAVWFHNRTEVADRTALFRQTCREMCAFIGVTPGAGVGRSGVVVRA